jgi:hypothetical protein
MLLPYLNLIDLKIFEIFYLLTNFADKLRSLGQYSSLADSHHRDAYWLEWDTLMRFLIVCLVGTETIT